MELALAIVGGITLFVMGALIVGLTVVSLTRNSDAWK